MKKIFIGVVVILLAMTSISIEANEVKSGDYYFYFNSYSMNQSWSYYPEYMADGNESSYSYTNKSLRETELLTGNNFNLSNISIASVRLRAKAYTSKGSQGIVLVPVFNGITDGDSYSDLVDTSEDWTDWFNITYDPSGPGGGNWTCNDVASLDCKVKSGFGMGASTLYCSYVQIWVTSG